MEEATKDAQLTINANIDTENAIKEAQDKLNSAKSQLTLTIKTNFDTQMDQIKDSTSGLISVFEAMEKGMSKTTDAMGNSILAFSVEAAESINNIYPGFIQGCNKLADGTFTMSQQMYNDFLDATNGMLTTDVNAKVQMIDNSIAKLEAERDTMNTISKLLKAKLKLI
jgi:hypothetical protein